jgi:hypothetical protein
MTLCPRCPHPLSSHYAAYSSPQGDGKYGYGIVGKHGFRCCESGTGANACRCWLDEWPKEEPQGDLW